MDKDTPHKQIIIKKKNKPIMMEGPGRGSLWEKNKYE